MSDHALARLAEAAGIEARYWDIEGRQHETTPETMRALLRAFGLRAESGAEIGESLALLRGEPWREMVPPVHMMREGEGTAIAYRAPPGEAGKLEWAIVCENGEQRTGVCDLATLPVEETGEAAGMATALRKLPLPALPLGYHHLRLAGAEAETLLIVAPPSCHLPAGWPGRRYWGLAAQLYALRRRGDWGIGDFTALRALIAGAGAADAVGLNPLHALFRDVPEAASPYSPSSRLFCNPLYLDVEAIAEYAEVHAVAARHDTGELVDYRSVAAEKYATLEALFRVFQSRHLAATDARAADFLAFVAQGGEPLRKFALFEALCEAFGSHDWRHWPLWAQNADSPGARAFAEDHTSRIAYSQYLQWQCDMQLGAASALARERMAIGLYGDLAVSVDTTSADHWAERKIFAGEARIGAPPDPFNEQGQEWGVVPFDPRALRRSGYGYLIALFRSAMRHVGALRIDHVMGWQRLFLVPAGAPAASGAYVRYPLEDFLAIAALESRRNQCLLIGEDLGTVPAGFRERMAAAKLLSCRVFYFERDGARFRRPQEFPLLSAVSATTHDLATLRGYWLGEDIAVKARLGVLAMDEAARARTARAEDKRLMLEALRDEGVLPADLDLAYATAELSPALAAAIHAYLARTPSLLFVAQLDDLAGSLEQTNLPGTTTEYPNWRRRLARTLEDLLGDPAIREAMAAIARERAGPV